MGNEVTVAKMAGLYKEAYPEGIIPLAPELAKLYKELGDLEQTERVGNKFHQPVVLKREQGVTYGGGTNAGIAYALNGAVPMSMADAQLEGVEVTVQSQVALRTVSKSVGSAKAFKSAMRPIMESHMATHAMRKEISFWYGKSPTGLCATSAGNADSGTQETLTITPASWAVGLWAGQEGATLNAFRIDTGALISSGADAIFTLASVDPDNKKITLTGTSTGCTALHAQASQLYLDFAGARTTMTTYFDAEGIDYLCSVTSGTTVWNIDNVNTLWRPSTHSCTSGALTLGKVLKGINKPVAKGGLDEEVDLWVSAATWADLADSFSASRMLDSSYSTGEGKNGVEKVVYFGANGAINVKIHPVIKEGEAFAFPVKRCKKVGSTDITLNVPGRGDEIFTQLASNNGFEFRSYSDVTFFTEAPAKFVKYTTIVNAG